MNKGLAIPNIKVVLTQSYDFCFVHHFTQCNENVLQLKQPKTKDKKTASKNLHGHSVKIRVSVVCKDDFFSRDFMNTEVHKILQPKNQNLLNDYLNTVSCESLAQYLWTQLKLSPLGEYLTELNIQETQKNQIYIKKTSA
ncbi:MAG: hypothetical protein HAW63_05595 [Bdellovibrionaceae bacterium]|nr:hypothetical protein [Pseudobdellovibrionaceae bacterium]